MKSCTAIVDCRVDERFEIDFLTLNIWGKPVFSYVVEEILKCNLIFSTMILTGSKMISEKAAEIFGDNISICKLIPGQLLDFVIVSGRAIMLKANTIDAAIQMAGQEILYSSAEQYVIEPKNNMKYPSFLSNNLTEFPVNAFMIYCKNAVKFRCFKINADEAVVINTRNDFELAVVLKKKEFNKAILTQSILERISEKKELLSKKSDERGICLIGHSQIDNWNIKELCGKIVRNCGIRGISSLEYKKYILDRNLLKCGENLYIVMHGTNDIVYDLTANQIADSIRETIEYIRKRKKGARIFFVSCLHTNGRMDRNNLAINQLNDVLRRILIDVKWIDGSVMDDKYGNLKQDYTIDGLHLSGYGYEKFKSIIEKAINGGGDNDE